MFRILVLSLFYIVIPLIIVAIWWGGFIFYIILYYFILIVSSIKIVRPNEVRTVEFLWKFNRVLRPWISLILPIIEVTRSQILYRKNFQIDVDWITDDNVTAYIGLNIIYFVEDDYKDTSEWNIYKSIYMIDNPTTMMKSTIDEQLRAMMVTFTHKDIFEKREEIWEAIEAKLRAKLSSFGYKLDSIQVKDVKLEQSVMNAMNKIVETEKLREAAMNEAEAQKIKMVKEAEADKEAKILIWEWMAGQRMKIAEWFKESVEMIKAADETLNAEKILQFLLDSSRIETLWNIWAKDNTKLVYLNEDLEWRSVNSSARESKLIAGSDIINNRS